MPNAYLEYYFFSEWENDIETALEIKLHIYRSVAARKKKEM